MFCTDLDAPLTTVERALVLLDSRLEVDAADLDGVVFEAVRALVHELASSESRTLDEFNAKTRLAARLEERGWDDLVEIVARSVARDALQLTYPAWP